MSLEEVRVVDPTTGGEKGAKLARFSLIPTEFLWELACHYGRGARKYADRNWEKGYKWSLSVDALERHLAQWKLGETTDAETGTHHLVAVAWHACALFVFHVRGLGHDDVRVSKYPASWTEGVPEELNLKLANSPRFEAQIPTRHHTESMK